MCIVLKHRHFVLGMRSSRRIGHGLAYLSICTFLFVLLLPLYWMAIGSFKSQAQSETLWPIQWIPNPLVPGNYVEGWKAGPWLHYLANTMTWAMGTTIGLLISISLTGYAFARMKFRGHEALFFLNLLLMLLPSQVTMIPVFMINSRLGWVGTWKPVIVPCFLAAAPQYVFLMRQFFRTIPTELSEAARIDGCGELGILCRIILPLSKPAMAVMVMGNISWAWSDFMTSVIYFRDPAHQTLVLGMQSFIINTTHQQIVRWGPLMAMSVVWAMPMMVLFYFSQRYFTQTFTLSGITG